MQVTRPNRVCFRSFNVSTNTQSLLTELRNYNRKLFLCPPQKYAKIQPAIFHDKVTLWQIKLSK